MTQEKRLEQRETHIRSILKGISYRILGSLATMSIAYFFTGDTTLALGIGGIEAVVKVFVYYVHERAWQLVPRGTIRHIEEEIITKRKKTVISEIDQ